MKVAVVILPSCFGGKTVSIPFCGILKIWDEEKVYRVFEGSQEGSRAIPGHQPRSTPYQHWRR